MRIIKQLLYSSLLAISVTFMSCNKESELANYSIVPLPQSIEHKDGKGFIIDESTKIYYLADDESMVKNADFLAEYISQVTGMKLKAELTTNAQKNAIVLKTDLNNKGKDAYTLTVSSNGIEITGASSAGVFYGIQTLRKSIAPVSEGKTIQMPAVEITDYPRFEYRGMHLDVSRHFFSIEFVKKYLDLMALHNINVFHWHLTDDQGWRIEIKSHPKLTEVGSVRPETLIGSLYQEPHKFDGIPYGGFYTQEEIKDIVKYAADRYITTIPEVDLPGHMLGVLKAYPELGCTGGPYELATKWGVFEDVLCAGNEYIYPLLEDIFTEIAELFPSKYIHIGGDECPKTRWKACPKCQAKIKKDGLKADKKHSAEDKLQSYVMTRIEKFLNEKGRQVIGWDEILEGNVAPNATIMSWRGIEGGIEAARLNHNAIMVPHHYLYFDYYHSRDRENEPLSIGGYSPLDWIYSYEPLPDELTENQKTHIIGVQGNLWAEYISTTEGIEYMLLPRIAALSDIQWSNPKAKSFKDFMIRLENILPFYEKMNCNYAKHIYGVYSEIEKDEKTNSLKVSLISLGDVPIYYTTDGTEPTIASAKYESPITIPESLELKAIAIHPNRENKSVVVELEKKEK